MIWLQIIEEYCMHMYITIHMYICTVHYKYVCLHYSLNIHVAIQEALGKREAELKASQEELIGMRTHYDNSLRKKNVSYLYVHILTFNMWL